MFWVSYAISHNNISFVSYGIPYQDCFQGESLIYAYYRWVNMTHGAGLSSRKSVLQLEQPWLPVACAGHSFGEEVLEEERLWRPDAGGFLQHIPVRRIYRRQHSAIAQHGGRSEKPLNFLILTLLIFCHKLSYLLE